jgi:hypothetical protein
MYVAAPLRGGGAPERACAHGRLRSGPGRGAHSTPPHAVRVRPRDVPAPCRHPPTGAGVSLTCHGSWSLPGSRAVRSVTLLPCARPRRLHHGELAMGRHPGRAGARLAGASAQPPTGPVPRWQRHQEGAGSIHDLRVPHHPVKPNHCGRNGQRGPHAQPRCPEHMHAAIICAILLHFSRLVRSGIVVAERTSSRMDRGTDSTSRAAKFGADPI